MNNNNRKTNKGKVQPKVTLPPRPVAETPPLDPPTLRKNPVRKITVSLTKTLAAATPVDLTVLDVRNALDAAGYSGGNFAAHAIHCWLDGSDNNEIELKEPASGVSVTDDGSFSQRARAGLRFPPVLQTTRTLADATVVLCTATAQLVTSCEFRVVLSWWGVG